MKIHQAPQLENILSRACKPRTFTVREIGMKDKDLPLTSKDDWQFKERFAENPGIPEKSRPGNSRALMVKQAITDFMEWALGWFHLRRWRHSTVHYCNVAKKRTTKCLHWIGKKNQSQTFPFIQQNVSCSADLKSLSQTHWCNRIGKKEFTQASTICVEESTYT